MKTLFTFLTLFIAVQLFAQQQIADVRNKVGQEVTVNGIVTNGSELGSIRYFQDGTAGLAAYDSTVNDIKRGDSITITGTLKDYRNLLELDPVKSFTIISSGNDLPAPKILTIDEMGELYEGKLIEIKNIEIINANGTFSGSQNYEFTDGTHTGELRINTKSPAVGQVIPSGKINLIGICSQFSYNTNDVTTGYQLLVRDMDDFISSSSINLTSPVEVKNITTSGFTLTWKTDVDGSSVVKFGNSTNPSSWTETITGTSTADNGEYLHEATISSLDPATIVYTEVYSVSGTDTAFSSVNAFATESNSTGSIKVYFNTPVDESVATGAVAQSIGDAMEDTLIAYINRATESIDFCIYNINNSGLSNVSQALNDAYNRGVKIRFISDGTTAHSGTYDLSSSIPYLEGPESSQRDGIMHNKFAIFDAESADPTKPIVWTGSMNLTYDQIDRDANNIVFVQDQTLAKTYTVEFEEMWGSTGDQPNEANAKFGNQKTDNTPHEFIIGGNRVQCYFSPSDGTNQQLINAINTSDNDLNIETMLITRSDIATAISDAKQRGVDLSVITNSENENTTTVNNILNNALPAGKFVFDTQATGILHNKLAIIDAKDIESDPQVITGSHNWSNSANDINDENTLIIHSAELANIYYQQFAFRFVENGGSLVVSTENIEMADVKVYPNPTDGEVKITAPTSISKVEIFTLSGKLIQQNSDVNSTQVKLQMQNNIAGIYILKVQLQDGNLNTYKIVKK